MALEAIATNDDRSREGVTSTVGTVRNCTAEGVVVVVEGGLTVSDRCRDQPEENDGLHDLKMAMNVSVSDGRLM